MLTLSISCPAPLRIDEKLEMKSHNDSALTRLGSYRHRATPPQRSMGSLDQRIRQKVRAGLPSSHHEALVFFLVLRIAHVLFQGMVAFPTSCNRTPCISECSLVGTCNPARGSNEGGSSCPPLPKHSTEWILAISRRDLYCRQGRLHISVYIIQYTNYLTDETLNG